MSHTLSPKPLPYLKLFALSLVLAGLIFLPFLILDGGYFFYYGDFNVQQIPFYLHAHEYLTEGPIGWDWGTDLGSGFVGSYSFYLLGSPFFWLSMLLPLEWVPFAMAPLLMLKFAAASLTGYGYLKRFTKRDSTAAIGALLYAFSGFQLYNVFFNHFHEAVIVFPLLLIAMEETMINRRRGWFALAVGLCGIVNYYFFFGQVIFCLIYFVLRCLSKDFRLTVTGFFSLVVEAVLGLLLSCCLLLPSAMMVMQNPRVDNILLGYDALFYDRVQRYGLILQSLFFPPDIPARANFFPESNARWASVSAYLPLFSLTGVVVYFKSHKKTWLKRILAVCAVMAFVPLLNSLFSMANTEYYARWFYMPILMLCLATVISLEQVQVTFKSGIKFCAVVVGLFLILGILPSYGEDGELEFFSMTNFPDRYWAYMAIAGASLVLVWLLIKLRGKLHWKQFARITTLCVCVVIFGEGVLLLGLGRSHGDDYTALTDQGIALSTPLDLDSGYFFRVDEDGLLDNAPMNWGYSTIQCFHSVVEGSIMEFYDVIGVNRDVASRPDLSYFGLRGLTSVRYCFVQSGEETPNLPGFTYLGTQNGLDIYQNDYFIPMGFTYDKFITRTQLETYPEESRDKVMLEALCLSDEDAQLYSYLMEQQSDYARVNVGQGAYLANCTQRAASSCDSFTWDHTGFEATISLDAANLVFFSVPYDAGWSATVNGQPAEIVTANVGFMAVLVPAGESTITFTYQTPGMTQGLVLTGIGGGLLVLWLGAWMVLRRKDPVRYAVLPGRHRSEAFLPVRPAAGERYLKWRYGSGEEEEPEKRPPAAPPQEEEGGKQDE